MSITPFSTYDYSDPTNTLAQRDAATARQIETLRTMMFEKAQREGNVRDDDALMRIDAWIAKGVTRTAASAHISRLIEECKSARSTAAPTPAMVAETVPAGRYAVETNDGATNTLAFYKVDRPTEGRWAGYVFVKHIVSDDEQRMSRSAGAAILAKIEAAGAEAASKRYGQEIGKCGVCGRTLTNDDSRALGIGPICAESF